MSQSCPQWRGDIGAYIVGALDGPARDRVTRHMAVCVGCKADFEELFPVRGWLGMAFGTTIPRPEPAPAPEHGRPSRAGRSEAACPAVGCWDALDPRPGRAQVTELPGRPLQDAVSVSSRRRRRRWLAAAGTAAGATGAAVAAIAVLASSGVSSVTYRGLDTATGVSGRAQLHDTPAGTQIDLTASGLPRSERCILVAVDHGRTEIAGSWHVTYEGWARVVGTTGFAAGQLTALRIESVTGHVLLSIRL